MGTLVLRDGTRLRVREGVDPQAAYDQYMTHKARARQTDPAFQEKVAAQEAADREEYNPTKGMSNLAKLAVGNTQGFARAGRGIGDMLGLMDPEDVAAKNKLDKPLEKTGAGKVGSFVGNTAALMGATMPLGTALAGLGGTGAVASSLARGVGNVAAQGALGGAINAAPGERGSGAALGALIGGATYGALKGGGRLAKGLVPLSDDAKTLSKELGDVHIPLHLSADQSTQAGRSARMLYGIANESPLDLGMLARQQQEVVSRYVALRGANAVPKNLGLNIGFTADDVAGNFAKVAQVEDAVNALTSPFKRTIVALDGKFYASTVTKKLAAVRRANPKVANDIQAALDDAFGAGNQETTLEQVLHAISGLKNLRNSVGGTANASGAGGMIDDVIKSLQDLGTARVTGNTLNAKQKAANWAKVVKVFDEDLWKWNNFKRGMAEMGGVKTGKFTPGSLLSGMKGQDVTGSIPDQRIALRAAEVLDDPNIGSGFRTGVALAGSGALVGVGAMGGIPGAALALSATPALATKTAQRALSGQLTSQKAIADLLRNNPDLIRQLGGAGTAALTPQGL